MTISVKEKYKLCNKYVNYQKESDLIICNNCYIDSCRDCTKIILVHFMNLY